MFNEIKLLKDKIKQIETSISIADLSQQNANINIERQFSSPPSSSSQNLSKSLSQPQIQKLPSIQSFSPTPYLPVPSPSQFPPPTTTTRYSPNYSYTRNTTISDNSINMGKHSEFDFLFNLIQIDSTSTVDFFSGVPVMMYKYSRVHSYGPLALLSSMLNDRFSGPIKDQVMKFKKKNIMNAMGPQTFKNMIMDTSGIQDIEPVKIKSSSSPLNSQETNNNKFNDKSIDQVIIRIIDVLPPPKVTWMLIQRFFKYVYPMSPYLDQKSFINDVQKLTNSSIDDVSEIKLKELVLTKKLDLAILGSLLLVLKLSYLTLSGNLETPLDYPPNSNDESYLLTRELNPNLMTVAQDCLNQFNLLGRCALPIFQCAFLMFEYKKIDSFDGFADGEAHIYINMLINVAYSIGLNNDPTKFDTVVGNSPLGNLWRKIWYGLVAAEHVQFSESGVARGIINGSYNTLLPTFKIDTSNIDDLNLEKKVIEMLKNRYELHCSADEIVNVCVNVKIQPSMQFLLTRLLSMEKKLLKNYGSLKDLLLKNHQNLFVNRVEKVYSIINYLQTLSMMKTIYFRILQSLDEQKNIPAVKFLNFKICSLFMDVLFNFHELSCHSYRYIGTGFDSFITPVLEVVIHRAWFVLMSLCFKTLIIKQELQNSPQTHETKNKLNEIRSFRERLTEFTDKYYLPSLTIISSKYFYAWRILKGHKFIFQLLKDCDVNYTKEKNYFNIIRCLNADEIGRLNELVTINNYNTQMKPSEFGKVLLERIRNNICDEDPRFPPLILSTFSNEPIKFAPPFENELNPSPNDDFWFGMYNKQGKNLNYNDQQQTDSFTKIDFNDIVNEYGLSDDKNMTPLNFTSKDEFFDQTIYDMFN